MTDAVAAAVDTVLMWLRRDLRLADNPALQAARRLGRRIVPVYIHDPEGEAPWAPGAASRWWLEQSLRTLAADLAGRGMGLRVREGPSAPTLESLAREEQAGAVVWGRRYEPAVIARDTRIKEQLRRQGLQCHSVAGWLIREPHELQTQAGAPYRVFTAFWRRWQQALPTPPPSGAPPEADAVPIPAVPAIAPPHRWTEKLHAHWVPGEAGAHAALARFLDAALADYPDGRDLPARAGTSRLSPHLHFGEISPLRLYHEVDAWAAANRAAGCQAAAEAFQRQIAWREFGWHLLYHFPDTPERPLDRRFEAFPWREAHAESLTAWQRGRTGIPIVDAGLRELWETGWMHNRVRMLCASLLSKNLRVPWQRGAAWFWDTLVDADLANNTLGWQWVAGCGADAAPYFRIFNPVRQGERFDPEGEYVRRWVPELARLPARHIHAPADAPESVRADAGVVLGRDYPAPLVDLKTTREQALEGWKAIRNRG